VKAAIMRRCRDSGLLVSFTVIRFANLPVIGQHYYDTILPNRSGIFNRKRHLLLAFEAEILTSLSCQKG
jgi:hypothetical protein